MSQDHLLSAIKEALREHRYKTLRPSRGVFQADVCLLNIDGQYVVVKDFSDRPWLSRVLVCRSLVKREVKVLEAFGASGFLPQCFGRISDDIFAMEFLEGEHPGRSNRGKWPQAYQQAREFLELFHSKGYCHNDFRRNNVLIQPDGSVRFFDFAAAIRKPRRFQKLLFVWMWLLGVMQRADMTSLLKMKFDLSGEPLTAQERRLLKKPKWVRALQRLWTNGVNKPILRRFK